MKKYILLLAILIMFLATSLAIGAGSSVTQTYAIIGINTNISTLTLVWTSDDATGAVSAATSAAVTAAIEGKFIVMVVTDPSATAPTDDYDITITDANEVDVMGGALANRDTANTEQALPYVGVAYAPRPITGTLTLNVTNAGNSKIGTVIIYLSR